MDVSAHRAFALLKDLAYERVSCSDAEKAAAQRLLAEAQSAGVDAHIEEFTVPCGRVHHAKLVVTAPYTRNMRSPATSGPIPPPRAAWTCPSTMPRACCPCTWSR